MYAAALVTVLVISALVQGFKLWSLALIVLLLLAIVSAGILRPVERTAVIAADAATALVVLFASWLFVSAYASPLASIAEVAVFQQLTLPLAFCACLLSGDLEQAWRKLLLAFAFVSTALAVLAFTEPLYLERPSFSTFFVQRNSLSGFLVLSSFVLLPTLASTGGAGQAAGRRLPWLSAVPIFLGLFMVFFSTSRAALAAFIVAYAGFYYSLATPFRQNLGRAGLALALWAFLLANLAAQGNLVESIRSLNVISAQLVAADAMDPAAGSGGTADAQLLLGVSPLMASKIASADERFLIWRATLEMLRDMPWTGYGPGSFRVVYPSFEPQEDTSARMYAHNDFLQIYAELGVVGLALCAALAGVVLVRWWSFRRRREQRAGRSLEVEALFWGMVAVAAHSAFDFNFYVPATLVSFGLVLARFCWLTRNPGTPRVAHPARYFGRPSLAFVVVALASLPTLTLAAATAMSVYYERGVAALTAGHLSQAERALATAAALDQSDKIEVARAQLYLAAFDAAPDAARKARFLALAARHLAAARTLNPYAPEIPYTELVFVAHDPALAASARAQAMAAAFAETLRRDRRYSPVRLELARYFLQSGQTEQARAVLEQGLRYLFVDHPLVLDYLALLRELRAESGDAGGALAVEREIARIQHLFGMAS